MKDALKRFTWEELNAYVDGEADVRAAAEIASAAANDHAVADAIAMLAGLKAASAEALAMDPPAVALPAKVRPRHFPPALRAMAAVLVAAVAIAATLFLMRPNTGNQVPPEAEALAMYETWLAGGRSGVKPAAWSGDGLAPVEIGGRITVIPDLAFARMRIGHLTIAPAGEGAGLFVGYVGRNSCRLGLWIAPAADAQARASGAVDAEGERRIAAWEASGLSYTLVAEGMDPARFLAITQHLREAAHPSPEPADLVAAARPSIANEPCAS